MIGFKHYLFVRFISLIVVELFFFTMIDTDLAWGLRENSSLSLVGRKNSAKASGQTFLRPRAEKQSLGSALQALRREVTDGGLKMVTVHDPIPSEMIAMGLVRDRYGEPKEAIVQQMVPVPKNLGEGDVLVAMAAVKANFTGSLYAQGKVKPFRKKEVDPRDFHILGNEGVGIVKEAGKGVKDLKVGDVVVVQGFSADTRGLIRVIGADNGNGTYGQFVKIKERQLWKIPEQQLHHFTVAEAASWIIVPVTTLQAAKRLRLESKDHALVWGMRGSTGTFFAQIAISLYGVRHVVGVTSSDKRGDEAIAQGFIDAYVNRTGKDPNTLVQTALEANRGKRFDVVFESAGGKAVPASLELLKPGGRLVTIGGTEDYDVTIRGRVQTLSLQEQIERLHIQPDEPVLFALNSRKETLSTIDIVKKMKLPVDKIVLLISNDDEMSMESFSTTLEKEGISFEDQVILRDDLGKEKITEALQQKLWKRWGEKVFPKVILQDTRLGLFDSLLQIAGPFTKIGIVNDTSKKTFKIYWPLIFYIQTSLHFADGTEILGSTEGEPETMRGMMGHLLSGRLRIPTQNLLVFPFEEIPLLHQKIMDNALEEPFGVALIGAPSGEMTLKDLQDQFFETAADGTRRYARDGSSKVEALQVAEEAREEWGGVSFLKGVFNGQSEPELLFPYPEQDPEDKRRGDEVLTKFEEFLTTKVNPHQIEQDARIPLEEIKQDLINLGAFGLKIPTQYGGLGLSQTNYLRVLQLVGSYSPVLGILLSAHQSIGLPQPLKLVLDMANEEEAKARASGDIRKIQKAEALAAKAKAQQEKYYRLLARGAISSFSITEVSAGSDPSKVQTTAEWDEAKQRWVLNGEKLWATNGPIADYTVILAKIKGTKKTTLFVVDKNTNGFSVTHRNTFSGLRGIENGVLRLENVEVASEDVLGEPGQGLKIALMTLNTGRLSLAVLMLGALKTSLRMTIRHANRREQFGGPIGQKDAIAQKIAEMAKTIYALEAVTWYPSLLVDQHPEADIRLESAVAKLATSEMGWSLVDHMVQIFGGRGYETARSKAARGEPSDPVEQFFREYRINRIFEGSTEIQHLIEAREALDTHKRLLEPLLNPGLNPMATPDGRWPQDLRGLSRLVRTGLKDTVSVFYPDTGWEIRKGFEGTTLNPNLSAQELRKKLFNAFKFYVKWYSSQWVPRWRKTGNPYVRYVRKTSRQLARATFHQMAIFGPALEEQQKIIFDVVDVANNLYLVSASSARTERFQSNHPEAKELMDLFFLDMKGKIEGKGLIPTIRESLLLRTNQRNYALAQGVLKGEYNWLLDGAVLTDWPAPDIEKGIAKDGASRALASKSAKIIREGSDSYLTQFHKITRRAKSRFENRDWKGWQRDARERFDLYENVIQEVMKELRGILQEQDRDKSAWIAMKSLYSDFIEDLRDPELAETFFNSVTRRIFQTVGVNPDIEFVESRSRTPQPEEGSIYKTYMKEGTTEKLVREILSDYLFKVDYEDLERDIRWAAQEIDKNLQEQFGSEKIVAVEMIKTPFYRNKAAYLVGRIRVGSRLIPLILPLLNEKDGITVDAVLMSDREARFVFSFTRSYFHVDLERYHTLIDFLKSIMPEKLIWELYTSLGHNKQGKSELFRALQQHLRQTHEKFQLARGIPGKVMIVFTLPSFGVAFKMIKDRFDMPKEGNTREKVVNKYLLVRRLDRVGRMVDAQEFRDLRFSRDLFSKELLKQLIQQAKESVAIEGDDVVIKHAYTERLVTPLDVYVRETKDPEKIHRALIDFGYTLKDLAAANIFPGDILLRNFGVTRLGRVVSYDYDDLGLLEDFNFRDKPEPRDELEEMLSEEEWIVAGENDIFPEEMRIWTGIPEEHMKAFEAEHGDLLTAEFWKNLQKRVKASEVIDIFPYPRSKRLRVKYAETKDEAKDGAGRQAVIAVATAQILKVNQGAKILTVDPPVNLEALARSRAVLAIDASLLENETTQKEFEVILSMLKSAGRVTQIWLVETNRQPSLHETLETLVDLYPFVKLMSVESYRITLSAVKRDEIPFISVGYKMNNKKEKMPHLDIAIDEPKKGQIVSAFSFMSLALGKDPALAELMQQVEASLKNIEASLVFTPTAEYLEAVETVYRQL